MRNSRNTASEERAWAARKAATSLTLAGVLALTAGCSGAGGAAWHGGDKDKGGAAAGPHLGATVTNPAADAKNVQPLSKVSFSTQGATGTPEVKVTDSKGATMEGKLASDGKTWVPEEALKWGATYTVSVTVTGADGKTGSTTSKFTVMTKPDKLVRVSSMLADDAVVGVGMPLIINFDRSVPTSLHDDVQRRMTVTSTPAQEGSWRWISDKEVHYRPKVFWKANSRISVRIAAGGVPLGSGWFDGADLTLRLRTGNALVMTVDNKTHKMTVTRDGKVIRTIPVSLGKPGKESSSGTMLIMEKKRVTTFDTRGELPPEEAYVAKDIKFAQRLTWGGEYIHAANWSENDQGHRNVSHGCINISDKNAAWLYGLTRIGDPVITKGTGVKLRDGNGWTDWNIDWDEYVKGSAIPYEG